MQPVTQEEFEATFKDAFLKPNIYQGLYFEVQTTCGNEFVPADVIGRSVATHVEALLNYLDGTPDDLEELCEVKTGWLARLSAPGFLDCTDWTAHPTEQDARQYLFDTYADSEGG